MITLKGRKRFVSLMLAGVTLLNLTQTVLRGNWLDSAIQTPKQSRGEQIYSAVPESLRDSFIKRMTLFLKLRSSRNWSGLYDLLLASTIRSRTKQQLVEDYRKSPGVAGTTYTLISFSPTVVESSNEQDWTIYGCAKLKGINFKVNAFIVASREAEEWRFSDLDMLTPRDTPFVKCSHQRQSPQIDKDSALRIATEDLMKENRSIDKFNFKAVEGPDAWRIVGELKDRETMGGGIIYLID